MQHYLPHFLIAFITFLVAWPWGYKEGQKPAANSWPIKPISIKDLSRLFPSAIAKTFTTIEWSKHGELTFYCLAKTSEGEIIYLNLFEKPPNKFMIVVTPITNGFTTILTPINS